jgi:hypothetical protein
MAYIFEQIAQNAAAQRINTRSMQEAREWYMAEARKVSNVSGNRLMGEDPALLTNYLNQDSVGKMYMFYYDAKYKDELPYWDRFPLIFVLDVRADRFWGVNLHYLPPLYRARLMNALYKIQNRGRTPLSIKLKLTYQVLKSIDPRVAKFAVKQYLRYSGSKKGKSSAANVGVRSRFMQIPYDKWDVALMLPTEQFEKQTKSKVWADFRKV